MNNPNAVHGLVDDLASEPQRDTDDFDYEEWFKDQTLPMQLGSAREVSLKRWFEAHGFVAVQIKYRPKVDKFRVVMQRGHARCCNSDDQVEDWLLRAASACGSESEQLIGLATQDGRIAGSFKLRLPRAAWAETLLRSEV